MLRHATPVFRVSSVVRAAAFYRDLLGFRLSFPEDADADPSYAELIRDDVVIHISSHAGDGKIGSIAKILVRDVDRLHAELLQRGAAIHLPPIDQTWGHREMYVHDPDGNCLRFYHTLQ